MAFEAVMEHDQKVKNVTDQSFTLLQRFVLRCFHPRAIFIELAGILWSLYFYWFYNWQVSLVVLVLSITLAILVVMNANIQMLSETTIGRIGLLHLNPSNLIIRLFGVGVLLFGVWQRSLEFSLGGISLIFLGHTFGWEKVDNRFA